MNDILGKTTKPASVTIQNHYNKEMFLLIT